MPKEKREKRYFSVQSLRGNIVIADDNIQAYSKYDAKQQAKKLYPIATKHLIREVVEND